MYNNIIFYLKRLSLKDTLQKGTKSKTEMN